MHAIEPGAWHATSQNAQIFEARFIRIGDRVIGLNQICAVTPTGTGMLVYLADGHQEGFTGAEAEALVAFFLESAADVVDLMERRG